MLCCTRASANWMCPNYSLLEDQKSIQKGSCIVNYSWNENENIHVTKPRRYTNQLKIQPSCKQAEFCTLLTKKMQASCKRRITTSSANTLLRVNQHLLFWLLIKWLISNKGPRIRLFITHLQGLKLVKNWTQNLTVSIYFIHTQQPATPLCCFGVTLMKTKNLVVT